MKNTKKHSSSNDDLDALVASIENPNVKPVAIDETICNFKSCKAKLTIVASTCDTCNKTFCVTHRLPEVHSSECAKNKRQKIHNEAKKDVELMKAMNARDPIKANKTGSLKKERVDAQFRLQQRLKELKDKRTKQS